MSKAISKAALKELIASAQAFCDHTDEDHPSGECDYLVISQVDLTGLLEDAE